MNGPAREDILHFIESRHGQKLVAGQAADVFRALDLDGKRATDFMADFAQQFHTDLTGYEPAFHHRDATAAGRLGWPIAVPHRFGVRLPVSVSDLTLAAQTGRWHLRYPNLQPVTPRDWLNWPLVVAALPVLAAAVIWLVKLL